MLFVAQRVICARSQRQSVRVSRHEDEREFFRHEEDVTLLSGLEVVAPDELALWQDMRGAVVRCIVNGTAPSDVVHDRLRIRFHVSGMLRSVWQAEFRQLSRHLWIP